MQLAMTLTLESVNPKTGPIPVSTTSKQSCPPSCPFLDNGCYFATSPGSHMWRGLSAVKPGDSFKNGCTTVQSLDWRGFLRAVANLPDATLWRHNQGGDLPGEHDQINVDMLAQLAAANTGCRGFTYTHYPLTQLNAAAIQAANQAGFTVNLSANNLQHADQLADSGVGPVVVVLPSSVHGNVKVETPAGRRVVVCPATYRDDVTCQSCQLCQRRDRPTIVGFPAHGAGKRKVDLIATA